MSDNAADTIVILSTELIEKITEQYFNKTMFKQPVRVVESKPHGEAGYMFSVSFVPTDKKEFVLDVNIPRPVAYESIEVPIRASNGRFVKKG